MKPSQFKKDYYGGALMVIVGLAAAYASISYRIGSLVAMGPGFFPCAVGALMAFTGILIVISARADDASPKQALPGHGHGMPDLRGAIAIIVGTLAFLFIGDWFGLLPATFAIVFICAVGDRSNTWLQSFILSCAMMVIAWIVFWYALQLQLPLFKTPWGGA